MDITLFLEDNSNNIYDSTYLTNGLKRFELRTPAERRDNCRAHISWYVDAATGVVYERKEYPCNQLKGEFACEDCVERINKKKKKTFSARIQSVSDRVLFSAYVETDTQLRQLRDNCRYRGGEFLAIPTGSGSEKFVVLDVMVKGSSPINADEAERIATRYGRIETSKRVSGTLGIDATKKKPPAKDMIEVETREFDFNEKKPNYIQLQIASIKAMRKIGNIEISEDTIQFAISKREGAIMTALNGMGFSPFYKGGSKKKVSLDEVKSVWNYVTLGSAEFVGDINAIPTTMQKIIKASIDEYNEKILDSEEIFDAAVNNAASMYGVK